MRAHSAPSCPEAGENGILNDMSAHLDSGTIRAMEHLASFRKNIIGNDESVPGPYGSHRLVYADWIASGRLYRPIEERMTELVGPWTANTHSESSHLGQAMTIAYREARERLRKEVNASADDVVLPVGSGMTGAVSKLQRMLGLKIPENLSGRLALAESERPVVFITHMEHHSNHTSWLETLADVVVLPPDEQLLTDPRELEKALDKYRDRPLKIGSFTAASNVTGIRVPYRELARIMHRAGGYCFVDFAASAPYDRIDMQGGDPSERLDAVYFSPHKYLGGPGSPGILAFNKELYHNRVPDQPGGGTVLWTNPWKEHSYIADIESREDGGTPAFLQTIKAALACSLKESMTVDAMHKAESVLIPRALEGLKAIPKVRVLAGDKTDRIGAISFYMQDVHFNLAVRLLSDRFGIQTRGGCSCAGTYGHYLLAVDRDTSRRITCSINAGDLTEKPGWIRASIHPTMSLADIDFLVSSIAETAERAGEWAADYRFLPDEADWRHESWDSREAAAIKGLWKPFA